MIQKLTSGKNILYIFSIKIWCVQMPSPFTWQTAGQSLTPLPPAILMQKYSVNIFLPTVLLK